MQKKTLGIDFGTCYSCAAYLKDDVLVPVKDTAGGSYQSTIPSAIFIEEDGTYVVGQGAINLIAQAPASFVHEFKRNLGSGHGVSCRGKRIETWELVAEMLKKIKKEAEQNEGVIDAVVLTVPASYNQAKKDLMQKAAGVAGFKDIELIDEPVAAAIYWQRKNREILKDGDITLVYDLGGGTFDTVLVKKQGESFKFVGTPAGDDAIGGGAFDSKILEDLAGSSAVVQQFIAGTAVSAEQEAVRLRFGQVLQDFTREFKHRLSEREKWSEFLPLAFGGMEQYTLTRDSFNSMLRMYIDRTMNICDAVVKEAGLSWEQVTQILLVGGSTRIPYVKEAMEQRFKRPVRRCDEPDMAVCYGAAVYEKVEVGEKKTEHPINEQKIEERGIKLDNYGPSSQIYLSNDWIYFESGKGQIYKMKIDGSEKIKVFDAGSKSIKIQTVLGEWIYYTKEEILTLFQKLKGDIDYYRLYKVKTNGSENSKINSAKVKGESVEVVGNWIYYISYEDGEFLNLCKLNTVDQSKYKLTTDSVQRFQISGDWIYYQLFEHLFEHSSRENKAIYGVYKVRTDGTSKSQLTSGRVGRYGFYVSNDWIYYGSYQNYGSMLNGIYKIKIDGTEKCKLTDDLGFSMQVSGDWFYYIKSCLLDSYDGASAIYKIKIDGTSKQKLNNDKCIEMKVSGDWVYYINRSDGYTVYKTRTYDTNT